MLDIDYFLLSSRVLPTLHSFPTRRSSDLAPAREPSPPPVQCARPTTGPRTLDRSEEHTSELQSLRQLVCRLLLEKKKHQPYNSSNHEPPPAPTIHPTTQQRKSPTPDTA